MNLYANQRESLIKQGEKIKYKKLKFTKEDEEINKFLSEKILKKKKELPKKFFQGDTLQFKEQIEQCEIFKIIQQMPKGVIHHVHYDSAYDQDWFIDKIAYLPTTFYNADLKKLKYFKNENVAEQGYKMLSKVKAEAQDKKQFDEFVKDLLKLSKSEIQNQDLKKWPIFEKKIQGLWELIFHKDIFKQYLQRQCEIFVKDGIYRIEARAIFNCIFDDDHKNIPFDDEVKIFQEVVSFIREKYCPLFSYSLIICGLKAWDNTLMEQYIQKVVEAKTKYPDFIIAFDLVQEEDINKPLHDFAEILFKKQIYEQMYHVELPLALHGGETLFMNNENATYDLILLNSKRIGHGLSFAWNSFLLTTLRDKEICIECNPLSNQVLEYITDLRNHPAKTFMNFGIPISINPDDPSQFGYLGVSYDYYVLSIAQEFNFKDLKLCAYNSIKYSLLDPKEQFILYEYWEKEWNKYASQLLASLKK